MNCINYENPNNIKAPVSSMQISTCTWHVALAPEVVQMVFCMLHAENSASSSVYPLSNTRPTPSGRLCRCKYRMMPFCVSVLNVLGTFLLMYFLFPFLTTKYNFHFYFPRSHHHMKPLASAVANVPPHWHKSEPNEAICMLHMSSVRLLQRALTLWHLQHSLTQQLNSFRHNKHMKDHL